MAGLRRIRTGAGAGKDESYRAEADNEAIEEPVTPAGRVFIHPDFYCTALGIFGFRNPVCVAALKQELMNTLVKHKRFSSLLKVNKRGREIWVKTDVNIDDHVIEPELSQSQLSYPTLVEDYAAELSSARLDMNKPLWEIHVLNRINGGDCDLDSSKAAGVCVFLFHHSLGDGTSLMSLFLASTRRLDNPDLLPTIPSPKKHKKQTCSVDLLRNLLLVAWYTITEIFRYLYMQLWQTDSQTVLSAYRGAEKEPSKLIILDFSLEDFKIVKQATNSTINDVLLAVVSLALKMYLEHHMQLGGASDLLEKLRVRALVMVNTRPLPGLKELSEMMKNGSRARWGNNMGYMLFPLIVSNLKHPLDYVQRAKAVASRKKLSYESHFTYFGGSLVMDAFGPKTAVDMTYTSTLHTTMTMSNVVGPLEEVIFAGNPVEYMAITSSSLPQAMLLHVISYAGRIKMSLMLKPKIIPDSKFLAQCFERALQTLVASSNSKKRRS